MRVLHQPVLLERHPEADEEDVRGGGVYLPHERLALRATGRVVEVAVAYAPDLQVGMMVLQLLRRRLGHTGPRAEEEEREAFRCGEGGEPPGPVGISDALRDAPAQDARRQHHARPVAEDYLRAVEKGAQHGIFVAEVEAVSVCVQHQAAPLFSYEASDLRVQVLDRQLVHADPEDLNPSILYRTCHSASSISPNRATQEFRRAISVLAHTLSSVSRTARLRRTSTNTSGLSARYACPASSLSAGSGEATTGFPVARHS